jgi:hypothetical protein
MSGSLAAAARTSRTMGDDRGDPLVRAPQFRMIVLGQSRVAHRVGASNADIASPAGQATFVDGAD